MPVTCGSLKVNTVIIFFHILNVSSLSLILVLVFFGFKERVFIHFLQILAARNEKAATGGIL